MAIVIASAHLSDDDFLAQFSRCELPLQSFRHGDHLRLAWLLLHRCPFDQALDLVRQGIRRYAEHHGAGHIYHETITTAWVKLIALHHEPSFDEFIQQNEERLNLGLLHRFWSPAALDSQTAKSTWLPPDRKVLPA
jgi:hypothetical protein